MALCSQLLTAIQVKPLFLQVAEKNNLQLYVCEEPRQVLYTFQVRCVVAYCQLPHVGVHWDGFMLV